MTRRAFTALLLLLCLATGLRAETHEPPKPMVVLFYADWCLNCKILLPKLAVAQQGLEDALLFVRLDSTNEDRKAESRERARLLGISDLWYANHATGWAALFDQNRKRVGELKQEMSVDELRLLLEGLAGRKPQKSPGAGAPATS